MYRPTGSERLGFTAEIRRLKYEDGKTAQEIADSVNGSWPPLRALGVRLTRSAILGYCHREGIKDDPVARAVVSAPRARKSAGEKWYSVPKRTPAPKPVKIARPPRVLEPIVSPTTEGLPEHARLWETRRTGECAWPYEKDDRFYSCCLRVAVRKDGSEMGYCPEHAKKMFEPRTKKPSTPAVEHARISRARGRRGY